MMKPKIINLRRTLPLIFFCTLCVFLITSPGVEASYITGSSQWGNTGSSIYYNNGNVGVGTATPSSKMEITGGPLRLTGTYLDINRIGSAASGINWYSQANNAWVSYMSPTGAGMGPKGNLTAPAGSLVNSWALRSFIESSAGYGWTFESGVLNGTTPVVKFEIRSSDGAFHSYGNGLIDGNVGIGIGTTNPPSRLVVKGTGTASTTSALDVQNNAGTSLLFIRNDGTIGINSTTPSIKLSVNGGTGNVIDVGGGFVSGLNSTPYSRDQAVPLSYLQDNYTSSSTVSSIPSFWAGSSTADIWNTNLRNVGIGTSNPATKLEVYGNGTKAASFINGNVGIGTTNPGSKLSIGGGQNADEARLSFLASDNSQRFIMETDLDGTTSNDLLGFRSVNTDNILVLKATGNVGIGTTNPGAKLELNGNSLLNGNVLVGGILTNTDPDRNGSKWSFDQLGNVFIGTPSYPDGFFTLEDGVARIGDVGVDLNSTNLSVDDSNSIIYSYAANGYMFSGGSTYFEGNVGINSTTPHYRLSISSSTADVINVGGGFVAGLNSTPFNPDQAVPLGYLQANYSPSSTPSFWTGSSTADIWNINTRNVGIGTTNPGAKLEIDGNEIINGGFYAEGGSGDVNSSGSISIADALIIEGYLKGAVTFTKSQLMLADVNGDGVVNSTDSQFIRALVTYGVPLNTNRKFTGYGMTVNTYDLNGNFALSYQIGRLATSSLDTAMNIVGGNVGIGTTNPTKKLHVVGTGSETLMQIGDYFSMRADGVLDWGGSSMAYGTLTWDTGKVMIGGKSGMDYVLLAGGSERMRILSGGNIGIGTTAPKNKLDVAGGMALGSYAGVNTAPSNSLIVSGNIGINSTTPNYRLSISSSTADVINVGGGFVAGLNSTPFNPDQAVPLGYLQANYSPSSTPSFWAGSSTADIWNTNARNVGIGTSSPATKLEVYGNGTKAASFINGNVGIGTTNPGSKLDIVGTQATGIADIQSTASIFTHYGTMGIAIGHDTTSNRPVIQALSSGTAHNLLINPYGGNVGIGTTNPVTYLDVTGAYVSGKGQFYIHSNDHTYITLQTTATTTKDVGFQIVGSSNLAVYQPANTTDLRFFNSSDALTIKSTGNVGIGTTAPKNKLDVAGSMALGSYAGVNTAPSNSLIVSGNIGINSTTPNYRLSISSSTADVINVGGGFVAGLNSTPFNPDQAVPLGYLQANYSPSSTPSFWAGSSTADIWNTNARNVGIGTSSPAQKLDVIGSIRTNNQLISTVANGTAPLVVTSGTLVTNLNADLLDGIDSARIPYLNNTTGEVLDANTLTAAVRIYRTTAGGTNFPVATNNGGVLNNYIAYDSNYGYQMFSQVSAGNMYWRTKSAGTWGAWKTIYDNGNLTNALTTNYLTKWNGSKLANSLIYDNGTNVGIGTTSTQYKLSLSSTNDKIGLYFDATRYSNIQFYNSADGGMYFDNQNPSTGGYNWQIAGANKMVLTKAGKVGIGSTTPSVPLSFGASTGDVINIAGGFISGLTIVPENRDQAVSYGFLTDNFAPITSLASSSWLLDGNTVGQIKAFGTLDKYDIPFMTNGTERMRLTDLGNLVLGATSTGVRLHVESPSGPVAFFKSKVNGGNYSGYLGNGNTYSGEEFGLYYALNDTRLAVYDVANSVSLYGGNSTSSVPIAIKSSNGYVGINTTTPTANLHVVGSAIVSNDLSIGGNITMSGAGSNISVNKLTVNTVDPLYNIQGINYASFAASIVGGVKEECLGRIKIDQPITDKEYEKIIDFNQVKAGSDLWVWRRVVDFNSDNVQVLITPYGGFANVYYEIKDNRLIFRADRPVEISYRLVGNRFDWKQWPTKALDQKEKAGFILR